MHIHDIHKSQMSECKKRKKAAYFASFAKKAKRQFCLKPGVKGFLATCNFREKDCVREATNLLTEFADKIYGAEECQVGNTQPSNKKIVFDSSDSEDGEKDDGIEDALAKEVNALQQERKKPASERRFQVVDSKSTNCVFIRSTVEDPVSLVEAILKDIESKGKQRTKFLLRLLPIEVTCKAWPEDIKTASGKLLDKYFKGEPKTFCVVYKRRNNSHVVRDELIQDLAEAIKSRNPLHRADMKQPDLTVIVEVICNNCLMAVVPSYFYYRKYNLVEVAKLKLVKPQDQVQPQAEESCDNSSVPTVQDDSNKSGVKCDPLVCQDNVPIDVVVDSVPSTAVIPVLEAVHSDESQNLPV